MSKDVFGYTRNPKAAGVLSNENSTLVIGNASGGVAATLVQGINIQYQQQVTEVFELGSNRVYWKKGRPAGQGRIDRMVGAGSGHGLTMFGKDALDVCLGGSTMSFKLGSGNCASDKPVTIDIGGVVVSSVGYGSSANDPQVGEGIDFRFTGMMVE